MPNDGCNLPTTGVLQSLPDTSTVQCIRDYFERRQVDWISAASGI